MANNYYLCTPTQALKSSKEEVEKLNDLITLPEDSDDWHGFQTEGVNDFYMYIEDGGDESHLPKEFLKELGKVIKANKLEYWEFGYCWYCDKMRPGEFGGGKFRITTDGELKYPEEVWKDVDPDKEAKKLQNVTANRLYTEIDSRCETDTDQVKMSVVKKFIEEYLDVEIKE